MAEPKDLKAVFAHPEIEKAAELRSVDMRARLDAAHANPNPLAHKVEVASPESHKPVVQPITLQHAAPAPFVSQKIEQVVIPSTAHNVLEAINVPKAQEIQLGGRFSPSVMNLALEAVKSQATPVTIASDQGHHVPAGGKAPAGPSAGRTA